MRFTLAFVSAVAFFTGLSSALSHGSTSTSRGHTQRGAVQPRRTQSLLINPDAQPDLPSAQAASAAASAAGLNLNDIQGDVLVGMKKNKELFYFFSIANATDFKPKLSGDILPLITTTNQLLDVSTQPITALNIAFSQTGLNALGATDYLGDPVFRSGQFQDLAFLGDACPATWVPEFVGTGIHGVFLFASDSDDNINDAVTSLESTLGDSITKVYTLSGGARPGDEAGHEHFGYLDGISNPAITGFTTNPIPGQFVANPGVILMSETGDPITRPSWAKDGSFLVFRQLKQLVPEFNAFLTANPIVDGTLTAQQGSDLLGARMVGRWKSGAPVDLAPLVDDPALGADPTRNNNFTFAHPDAVTSTNQTRCPFSAHIRKVRPRADLCTGTQEDATHHIMRAGIPYGPEVSDAEASSGTTTSERGLAFVAYQSQVSTGEFIQETWANNAVFVHSGVGIDPIVGQNSGAPRVVGGLDPTNSTKTTTLTTDFIISRGGEYFFSPSLSAIASKLSVLFVPRYFSEGFRLILWHKFQARSR
ncbi:dye-decolorizing peroxidase precursor [Mycena alexandri]|uniref:Dye-decolorizing peroxidase n=1 Tax=Mycena alexandri TaxID=1745969 RepID=A0AAD6SXA9_9AGAR|nr:dye-decolorizing peroxidase precursor [Mycena alexandri]